METHEGSPEPLPVRLPTCSTMNKKRYHEIQANISQIIKTVDNNDALTEAIMENIRTILKFDPDATVRKYTPEQGKKATEYRRKKAEELGVSVYEAFNHRNSYQKHKDTMIQRTTECRRRKAQEAKANENAAAH